MYPIHLIISILSFIVASKYGDWKNWEKYYSTILYLIIGDLIYNVIFVNVKPLWMHKSYLMGHTLTNLLLWMPIIYTSIVLLYIPHFPKVFIRQIFYVLAWLLSLILLEVVLRYFKSIEYYNNWNIIWSSVHWLYLILFLKVHYHKPFLAWILSFAICAVMTIIFKVPLGLLP